MRYITAEQFKEQPEEAQKVFLDWWKPQVGDLSCSKKFEIGVANPDITHLLKDKEIMKTIKERNTPLFTLQQLWDFIEDKTNYPVTVSFLTDEYWIDTDDGWSGDEKCFFDEDKLQAFWKCACEVARIMK